MSDNSSTLVHVCNVEEVNESNYITFGAWHFVCPKCNARSRTNSGASQVTCYRCKTRYSIKSNGEVHRIEQGRNRAVTVQAKGEPTAATPRRRGLGGILSNIAGAVAEANEVAHGKRLRDGLTSTGALLKHLDERVLTLAMNRFIEKCNLLEAEQVNWSHDGRIKVGRELQARARKEFDFNQAESYALWLAGAWLESGGRQSEDAVFVRRALDDLRNGP